MSTVLRRLRIKNFTVFAEADLEFCEGLNVFIGENGVGKTHLLKLPYAAMAAMAAPGRDRDCRPTKSLLSRSIAEKLVNVMRPDRLGRLARRQPGRQRCEVRLACSQDGPEVGFSFATQSKSEVVVDRVPATWLPTLPVFLPTRELLTIYPGFSALYDMRHLEFEETWRDTCQLLGSPTLKGQRETHAREFLEPLECLMGGRLTLGRNGRFYLRNEQGAMEVPLVAEGVRKLAMLARLVATGSLTGGTTVFWDEPESNLNPKLIKGVADAILHLAGRGVQAFVATHDLFLLREFELLLADGTHSDVPSRFFALASTPEGPEVVVEQGDSIEDVNPLVLLDETLDQSDRYLALDDG